MSDGVDSASCDDGIADEASNGASLGARRVRVLIVYRHAFLRDLVTKVLGGSGGEVVAAVKPEHLDKPLLDLLKPEVLVVDQSVLEVEGMPYGMALLGNQDEIASRVVLVDLSDPNILVWQKHQVTDADVAKLVEAVLERAA